MTYLDFCVIIILGISSLRGTKMKVYIIHNSFHYEIENLVRVFFPNEKLEMIKAEEIEEIKIEKPCIIAELVEYGVESQLYAQAIFDDYKNTFSDSVILSGDEKADNPELERKMAMCVYDLLVDYTGITPPWGILTGVRPIKLFRKLCEEKGKDYTKEYFRRGLAVSEEKVLLAEETEKNERVILDTSSENSFSLYVSVPFCPTRCSYCSFVSQSVEKTTKLIEPYVELVCQELTYTAKIVKDCKLKLETVYIGGGTPTTLNAQQLEKVISTINANFDMESCREFTVEAGRPDTVTEDKLKAILEGGADRISINPQTMNDEILEKIGRKHTAQQTIDAFNLARRVGFKHINMDLIVGLPDETFESFKETLRQLAELDPESITVHTLAMKRSSNLTSQGMQLYKKDAETARDMHSYCKYRLSQKGYRPYYLYRQSRMVGNLENIGYAKKGFDGLYNVFIMDETHSIIACGAGAVTKLKNHSDGSLKRIFNYKYPYEYINSFDEMLKRKDEIKDFYKECR